jgi:hypothetical protein
VANPPRAWWQVAKGRQMSGFTRDPYWYGGLLVYEPLDSKWRRYHGRAGSLGVPTPGLITL